MSTSAPSEASRFTAEQLRILGQAYRLILSWPKTKGIAAASPSTPNDTAVEPDETAVMGDLPAGGLHD